MKLILVGLSCVLLAALFLFAQTPATNTANTQSDAIVNLRKLAFAESSYAIHHPDEGFACDPQVLTKLEPPDKHVPMLESSLLIGKGQYKFSARCASDAKPAGKLHVIAEPLDPKLGLPTFCATGTFHRLPLGTSEFPIRKVATGSGNTCLTSGKPLT